MVFDTLSNSEGLRLTSTQLTASWWQYSLGKATVFS